MTGPSRSTSTPLDSVRMLANPIIVRERVRAHFHDAARSRVARHRFQQRPAETATVQLVHHRHGRLNGVVRSFRTKVARHPDDRRLDAAVGVDRAGADRHVMVGVGVEQAIDQVRRRGWASPRRIAGSATDATDRRNRPRDRRDRPVRSVPGESGCRPQGDDRGERRIRSVGASCGHGCDLHCNAANGSGFGAVAERYSSVSLLQNPDM